MVVNIVDETFPKDINGNYIGLESSSNQSKKFYHFAESPSKFIISHEFQSSSPTALINEPSKGVKNVLLGPPREERVINYNFNYQSNDIEDAPKTTDINDRYSDLSPTTELNNNNHHVNRRDKLIGSTVSVSTCASCGSESKPNHRYSNFNPRDRVDSSSSRSTPIRGFYQKQSSTGKQLTNNCPLSNSQKIKKSLQLKGCHICNNNKYKQSSSPSLSLSTSSGKRITNDCPYSIVLGSFHPGISPYNLRTRSGNGSNRSTGSKEETRRALIMIFTITSILLFLMITYYGTIIYLRLKNTNQNNYE